jgi:small-conductance mechanosensitive channel
MEGLTDTLGSTAWMPRWAVGVALLATATLLAAWLHVLAFPAVSRMLPPARRALLTRARLPSRMAVVVIGIALTGLFAPLTPTQMVFARHSVFIAVIALLGWFAMTALHVWAVLHLRRFKLDSEDNLLARKHVTQIRILQRAAGTLIVVITVSAGLMTFEGVRQYGVSLLASAGAAGLVIGLALQPMLKNLIAGIQIAVTQPIRIDDAVLVENEWGNVEEITSSYVVVRLWDWRRLIVPLSYFLEKPFQNWTREGAALIGSVILYTDFTVPIPDLRAELEEVVRSSNLWDGRVVGLQVTDFKENAMEIRMLVSASNSAKAFDLRCEVREQMIAYVQDRYPHALPRLRTEMSNGHAPGQPRLSMS